jgi:hypothetical protein
MTTAAKEPRKKASATESVNDESINQNTTAIPVQEDLIESGKALWTNGARDRLKLGEIFSKLRKNAPVYLKAKNGLSYNQAVSKMGVPRGTAENYRAMWDTKEACGVSGDLFLVLCDYGCNLATMRTNLGGAFRGAIGAFSNSLTTVHATDTKAVEALAKEIKAALNLPAAPKEAYTDEVRRLQDELSELVQELPKAKSAEESGDIAESIHQKREELVFAHTDRMQSLVASIAPFIEWDEAAVKTYMEKFSEMTLSLQEQTYKEAVKLLKSLFAGLNSLLPKAEVKD